MIADWMIAHKFTTTYALHYWVQQMFRLGRHAAIPARINLTASFHSTPRHATTILCVRKDSKVVLIGDGQVSQGNTVCKPNAKKVRRIGKDVLVGFAGSTADAFTLLERLEEKLEEHPGQLTRACVDLAKAWRTDKYLRRLEAVLLVCDKDVSFELTGNGDVLEPKDGVMGVGSGGLFATGTFVSFYTDFLFFFRSVYSRTNSF